MFRVDKTAQAELDLDEIWLHIALDKLTAADRLLDDIDRCCRLLARESLMGRARPELASNVRSFSIRRYVVFYVPSLEGIEVVRVLHGARDVDALVDEGGFDHG